MKQISEFFNAPVSQLKPADKPLTDEQRDAVAYFFAKLKIADSRFYDLIMPDETTERIMKREFANMIKDFTQQKIDYGFSELHKLLACNNPEYKFLTIQKVIGLIANNGAQEGNPAGAFQYFPRELALEDKTAKEKRKELGKQESAKLLAMFGDEDGSTTTN